MKSMIKKMSGDVDVDRFFFFADPLVDMPRKCRTKGEERVNYTRDEVCTDFIDAMQRLVTKVKDILDDPKTNPLVERAQDLEVRLQVWKSSVLSVELL